LFTDFVGSISGSSAPAAIGQAAIKAVPNISAAAVSSFRDLLKNMDYMLHPIAKNDCPAKLNRTACAVARRDCISVVSGEF
jgi:phage tail tape-measure protein